jgi:hypothetical protein
MVNRCESLINVVKRQQAKGAGRIHAQGLDQKVRGQVQVLFAHLSQLWNRRQIGET